MKKEGTKKTLPKRVTRSLDPARDKYDPELDKYKDVVLFPKQVERANEILKKYPIPQWILDL